MEIPSFNIRPGESPAAVSERRKMAALLMKEGMDTSPIRSPWQGAARMAQALMGGMELNRADQSERDAGKRLAAALIPAESGGTGVPAAATAPASIPPVSAPKPGVPMASAAGKIYSNDEPSPLDPPSGADRDLAVRTVLAESGNQGSTGMQAVASVLRNRSATPGFGGDNVADVIRKPFQFEPMNTAAGRQRMASYDPNSPAYQNADAALTRAYAGEDPTLGATHFYAPKAQAAMGRPAPSWDNGQGVNIGDHRFFGGAGTPQVTAGMSPDAVSSQSRAPAPAAQALAAGQPASAARSAPMIPVEMQARLRALIEDPSTREYGMQLASQYIKPSQATFGDIGVDEFNRPIKGWIDPLTRTTTPASGNGPAQPSGERVIPPAPPGVDPKIWRDEQSKRQVQNAMPASGEDTTKLRNEVFQRPAYKNLAEAAPVYHSMHEAASRDNRAADVNLIYGMAKIMDPGSVVREGEMSIAQAIATLPQRLQAQINSQLNSTGRLDADVRRDIMTEAHGRIQAYQRMYNQDSEFFRGVATRNRMSPEDVIPSFGEFPQYSPPAPPMAAAPAPGQTSIDVLLKKYGTPRNG